jgi:parvulin-like peptidyl-prolyl isomerase
MRIRSILLGLTLGLAPALSLAAETPAAKGSAASAPAAKAPAATAPAARAAGAYAVLTSAPVPPRPGCRTKSEGGELRAELYSAEAVACPVARVVTDEIALGELANALAAAHTAQGSRASRGEKARGMDFAPTLDRIIDVRLLVLEAREMGLTEQPEYREAMDGYRASTLRTTLQEQAAASARPDAAEVDRIYKATVKQWKVRSVMFEQEGDANAFRTAVGKGGSFDALARAEVAEKRARGGEPGFVSVKEMVPELAQAANALKQGQVSQPVKLEKGWVVLKLEGIRYPEDPKARQQARAQSLAAQQHKAVRAFHQSLVKKYATVDEKLLAGIDFEAGGEAGFQALARDERSLAQIRGEKPITVAELTAEVSTKFFHGIADPIKEKRVNPGKTDAFERLLGARLFAREARERKLDQSPAYLRKVEGFDRVLAFNTFLERVLIPEVKVTEAEVQALYEQRKGEFATPQMYRLDGLGFSTAKAAQAALEKLKGGTDLEWVRANTEGRLKPEEQKLQLQGALLSVNTLPPSLVKALVGAQPGDYRIYAADDGAQHHLVRVVDQVAPSLQPYPEVREKLAREVEGDKVAAAIRDYAARLRKVQQVDVLITLIVG